MTAMLAALRRNLGSLTGRIALILMTGTLLAVVGALLVAERARKMDMKRAQAERVIASALDVISRLEADPVPTERALRTDQILGARITTLPLPPSLRINPYITPLLKGRVAEGVQPSVAHAPAQLCAAESGFRRRLRVAGFNSAAVPPDCWVLQMRHAGAPITVAIYLPPWRDYPTASSDPLFLILVIGAALTLSLIAARLATAPLRRLSSAADAFARSIDAEPVAEAGPSDVRAALATFNLMQARVREGLWERMRMLAAISHDLQTPLTRLRLRLEQVQDEALQARLIADLSATLTMIRRGLDLARSGETGEDWLTVDLDSLLSSMADDAVAVGQPVCFVGRCGARVRVRTDALNRCLTNLIDNAVKYAGDAAISCRCTRKQVTITVRDHGPGIEAALLERAFEPFVRGAEARSGEQGTGIGLAIARAQAAAIGGTLSLANHPDGGLEARLVLPAIG